jgi:hypothetical protein
LRKRVLSVCIIFVFVISLCFFSNSGNLFSETTEFRLPFIGTTKINTGSPYHTGVSSEALDFGLAYDQEVYVAGDGKVVMASYGWNGGLGNVVKIQHTNSYLSIYAHLSEIVISVNDNIKKGQLIGRVGNTGNVIPKPTSENPQAGKHLHFEIRNTSGQSINIASLVSGISGLTAIGPPVSESKFASANPVRDNANIIDQGYEDNIRSLVIDLERKTTAEVVVVTVNSLEGKTIEKYAFDLFNSWGIGKKEKNNGVLFLVAPNEKWCRIEVGIGLENIITDYIAKKIIDEAAIPNFKNNNYGKGTYDSVKRISDYIMSALK